jgi:hypothetical protein
LVAKSQADLQYAGWTLFKEDVPSSMYSELRDEVEGAKTGWTTLFGKPKKGTTRGDKDKNRLELPLD